MSSLCHPGLQLRRRHLARAAQPDLYRQVRQQCTTQPRKAAGKQIHLCRREPVIWQYPQRGVRDRRSDLVDHERLRLRPTQRPDGRKVVTAAQPRCCAAYRTRPTPGSARTAATGAPAHRPTAAPRLALVRPACLPGATPRTSAALPFDYATLSVQERMFAGRRTFMMLCSRPLSRCCRSVSTTSAPKSAAASPTMSVPAPSSTTWCPCRDPVQQQCAPPNKDEERLQYVWG